MRVIDYLVYQLNPFGSESNKSITLQPKLTFDEVITNLKPYMDKIITAAPTNATTAPAVK